MKNSLNIVLNLFVTILSDNKLFVLQGETLTISSNEGILRIYNNLGCKVSISNSMIGNFSIEPLDVFNISCSNILNKNDILSINVDNACQFETNTWKQPIFIHEGKVRTMR